MRSFNLFEKILWQGLGETISCHIISRDVAQSYDTLGKLLLYEVILDVNMFAPATTCWVHCKSN